MLKPRAHSGANHQGGAARGRDFTTRQQPVPAPTCHPALAGAAWPDAGGDGHQRVRALCLRADPARDEDRAGLDICASGLAEHGECHRLYHRRGADAAADRAHSACAVVRVRHGDHDADAAGDGVRGDDGLADLLADRGGGVRGDVLFHRRRSDRAAVSRRRAPQCAGDRDPVRRGRRYRDHARRRFPAPDDRALGHRIMALWLVYHRRDQRRLPAPVPMGRGASVGPCTAQHGGRRHQAAPDLERACRLRRFCHGLYRLSDVPICVDDGSTGAGAADPRRCGSSWGWR